MIYEVIGWVGTFLILVAYFLLETRKLTAKSKKYQLLNILGATGIIVNSAIHGAIPSIGLNVAWVLIALYALYKIVKKKITQTSYYASS